MGLLKSRSDAAEGLWEITNAGGQGSAGDKCARVPKPKNEHQRAGGRHATGERGARASRVLHSLVPCERVISVLPALRTLNIDGALMSYHSFLRNASTLRAGTRQAADVRRAGSGRGDAAGWERTSSSCRPSWTWSTACSCLRGEARVSPRRSARRERSGRTDRHSVAS